MSLKMSLSMSTHGNMSGRQVMEHRVVFARETFCERTRRLVATDEAFLCGVPGFAAERLMLDLQIEALDAKRKNRSR